jgi:hypothetical protein
MARKLPEVTHLKSYFGKPVREITNEQMFDLLRSFPKLVYFKYFPFNMVRDDEKIAYLTQCCSKLSQLYLSDFGEVTDAGLIKAVQNCRYLRKLSLHSKIKDETVSRVIELSSNMRELSLEKTDITDDTLSGVLVHCPNLKALRLNECRKITDKGIIALSGHSSQKLISLALFNCGITDQAIFALAESKLNLIKLNLSGCSSISDLSLIALAKKGFLKEFIIYKNQNISDAALFAFATHCKEISDMRLIRCSSITEEGVLCLIKHCRKLIYLCLLDCPKISPELIKKVESLGSNYNVLKRKRVLPAQKESFYERFLKG